MRTVTAESASRALREELRRAVPGVTEAALDVAVGPNPTSMSADERLRQELQLACPQATSHAIEHVIERMSPSVDTTRRLLAEASSSRSTFSAKSTENSEGRPPKPDSQVTWTAEDQRAFVRRVVELGRTEAGQRPAAIARAALAQVVAERQTREIRESGRR